MKQFQVPQFIDVEDKILGPITMRQFFIMLIPMGAGILLYFLLRFWLVIILEIPLVIGCAVFAFYRPYGMRFSRFFSAFLSYSLKPRMFIWKHEERAHVVFTGEGAAPKTAEAKKQTAAHGGLKAKRSSVETGSVYREES
ncbi:PrgI family protein [Candidatus Azambacteria bacterium]|nr:PrgI family protein [Candidatus Azambacteria bacterium]